MISRVRFVICRMVLARACSAWHLEVVVQRTRQKRAGLLLMEDSFYLRSASLSAEEIGLAVVLGD